MKRIINVLLSIIMFLSMLIPLNYGSANSPSDNNLSNGEEENRKSVSTAVYQQEKVGKISSELVLNDSSVTEDVYGKKEQTVIKKSIKPEDYKKAFKGQFTETTRMIAAYFLPQYYQDLTDEQRQIILTWDSELVNQAIKELHVNELQVLEEYVPSAINHYLYYKNHKKYLEKNPILFTLEDEIKHEEAIKRNKDKLLKENTILEKESVGESVYDLTSSLVTEREMGQVSILSEDTGYKLTEFKNEFNYSVNTDELVDPLYRTANRKGRDLLLSGKYGLDITLERNYNSLQSKIMNPEYTAASGSYTQQQGNLANVVDPNTTKNFVATGWT